MHGWLRLAAWWSLLLVLAGCGGGAGAYEKHAASPGYATATGGDAAYPQAEESYEADLDAAEPAPASAPVPVIQAAGGAPPPAPPPPAGRRLAQAPAKPAPPGSPPASGAQPEAPEVRADVPAIAEPLLIYTATLHLAVFETDATLAKAERMARDIGGYLVRRDDTTIVFRVPARKFQSVMETVGELGDVLHREVTAEDVTEQFYDLQIRLKNLRAVRDRFEKLLEQAKTVEEALHVQRELERVTGEIERMEGRMKYLRELIAFATITIELSPRRTENVNPKVNLPFPWLNQLGLGNLLSL